MAGNSEDGLGGTWGGRGFFLDSSPKLTIVLPPPPRPPTQSTAEVEAEIAREIMYEEIHRVSNICSNENLKVCSPKHFPTCHGSTVGLLASLSLVLQRFYHQAALRVASKEGDDSGISGQSQSIIHS